MVKSHGATKESGSWVGRSWYSRAIPNELNRVRKESRTCRITRRTVEDEAGGSLADTGSSGSVSRKRAGNLRFRGGGTDWDCALHCAGWVVGSNPLGRSLPDVSRDSASGCITSKSEEWGYWGVHGGSRAIVCALVSTTKKKCIVYISTHGGRRQLSLDQCPPTAGRLSFRTPSL
jgi:hypothetical protein